MCTNNTNDNNNSSKVPLSTFEDLLLYMKNNGYNKIVVKPERGVGGNGQVLFEKNKNNDKFGNFTQLGDKNDINGSIKYLDENELNLN